MNSPQKSPAKRPILTEYRRGIEPAMCLRGFQAQRVEGLKGMLLVDDSQIRDLRNLLIMAI